MEERYLYEYDYAKPELTDEFLEHYGVLGMHWGIRKQPKYTGSLRQRIKKKKAYKSRVKALKKARKIKAKVSAEKKEAAKTKEEIIRTRDAAAMLKNIDKFTTQEINDFNNRENAISNLKDQMKKQALANQTKGQKIKSFIVKNAKEAAVEGAKKVIKTAVNMTMDELAKRSGSALLKKAFNIQEEKKQQSSSDNKPKKEAKTKEKKSDKKEEKKSEDKKQDTKQTSDNKKETTKSSSTSKQNKSNGAVGIKGKNWIKVDDNRSEAVLNLQKQQLNMDYARSVASADSNSAREKAYRSQINKNIDQIDKLLADIKKKK